MTIQDILIDCKLKIRSNAETAKITDIFLPAFSIFYASKDIFIISSVWIKLALFCIEKTPTMHEYKRIRTISHKKM